MGFIEFSEHNNSIIWLGGLEEYQNQGMGLKLLEHAIANLDYNCRITVNAYADIYTLGQPARKLYFKHGFVKTSSEIFNINDMKWFNSLRVVAKLIQEISEATTFCLNLFCYFRDK
ncbi:acetyltransferase family protein [Clostridium argentinense CDC 2741]|uniref:Acetyltransferase family protein n=1 Tax=Clostridium argentinense CDC 2741 TaxID=1418104 RepID=A0A0C1U564_9CLOT|nr:GNAT family N-acetyltransferase [Clostridium argentinense]ARC86139.1 N-acetyltransferase [Clostridium argentinense]KIE47884.1 acetyltransferase family protein [Clostridium argentinense CDC 2741]NFF40349.1 GNAT family N-acetyltransferase [Clostridium argentinense]NFP50156.1 GNAT family N-acetyltransferase [Clostridium argentinense]NFP72671.1 GNAT family N-acetyltransferase [Clostridium argentinense]